MMGKSIRRIWVNAICEHDSLQLYIRLRKEKDVGVRFKKEVKEMKGVQQIGGSSEGVTHTIKDTERYAFADWITKLVIAKTCPCNTQRLISAVKIENFIRKCLIF